MDIRRITRSRNERVVAGVAGGLGAFFNIDPMFVRLAFIVLAFINGIGGVLYLVLWLIVPNEDSLTAGRTTVQEAADEMRIFVENLVNQIRSAFQR
ncbi:PspC domain-containing protein [Candidatus Chloroploca sp. Khr17]|uniref:PspC domain-containing protein n=1 Tax=Candidatus Chloroploca sp. Khr17 TaxID=2496869 RepID=UPI00101E1F17|nr:PspC domain-containing protein [Candidatus Chloroploca sp. Khr17]